MDDAWKRPLDILLKSKTRVITIVKKIIKKVTERASIDMDDTKEVKRAKLQRVKPYLICPVCRGDLDDRGTALFCNKCKLSFPYTDDSYDFLTPELRERYSLVETDNISSNCYGGILDQTIIDLKDGLILDCGAGNRKTHLPNVINYEIVAYPSTDVLGVGEKLPFKDNTFDAIFSLAVLEHVVDPFACAHELERILKPGGKLLCQVPFLQPYHGYPNHYFNMTEQGLVSLFKGLKVESCEVPLSGHPIFTLSWFLNIWCNGLDPAERRRFENLRIKDLLKPGESYLKEPFVIKLDDEHKKEIASVNFLIATKPL